MATRATNGPAEIRTVRPSVRFGLILLHVLWQAAMVAAAGGDVPDEPPKTEWSKTVDGLQTRLVLDRARVAAGRWVTAYLDVRNVSDAPVAVAWMDKLSRLIHVKYGLLYTTIQAFLKRFGAEQLVTIEVRSRIHRKVTG